MNEKNKEFSTRHSSLSIRTPAIRFEGFSGEWVERALGEVADFNLKTELPEIFEYVDLESVVGTEMTSHRTENKTTAPSRAQRLARKGDVFYQTVRPYQKNNYLFDKPYSNYVFSTGYAQIRPYGDSYFLLTSVQCSKFVKSVLDNCTGTSYPAINSKDLANIDILYPNEKEQTKIGSYFQQLDTLITQHQRKHDKLLNVKKAMLEKMFPKKGAEIPEIRFKGFSDKWEVRKLGEIADRYDNLRVPITASSRVLGNTPYYGANGIQDYVKGYTHDGEFILIAEDGANDLKNYPVQYVNGKIWVNNHAHVLQSKRKVADNYFLKFTISQTNIEPFLVGGGRAKLNAETMMRIIIDIPLNTDEQTKIGKLFKHLDTLLSLHQTELEKLKNIKKACLEKMLV